MLSALMLNAAQAPEPDLRVYATRGGVEVKSDPPMVKDVEVWYFIDVANIRQYGHFRTVWEVHDYRVPQQNAPKGNNVASAKLTGQIN